MEVASFTRMDEGTVEDYEFLGRLEAEYVKGLADRVLDDLKGLKDSLGGYQIDRYEHSLQSATLAQRDGQDEEMVVAALLHDIGDELAPLNHGEFAASILKPYVSEKTYWIVKYHPLFQSHYFGKQTGTDPNARDIFKDHPWYQDCVDFCNKYDQVAFDPSYENEPLSFFEPMVRRLFARPPFHWDLKVEGSN